MFVSLGRGGLEMHGSTLTSLMWFLHWTTKEMVSRSVFRVLVINPKMSQFVPKIDGFKKRIRSPCNKSKDAAICSKDARLFFLFYFMALLMVAATLCMLSPFATSKDSAF